jgi:hypothetical protein
MPYIKHHTGFVCTKNTVAIIMMFPVKRFDVSEKLRRFLPHHCTIKRDFNYEHKKSDLYRNDYYFLGKKVGAVEDYYYENNFHFIDIVLNTSDFSKEDVEDIKRLSKKYKDVYYELSPGYVDGIGPSALSSKEFKELFFNYFSDLITFEIE